MAKRKIIIIDEDKCTGCGNCVTGCHEGALHIEEREAPACGCPGSAMRFSAIPAEIQQWPLRYT